MYAASMRHVDDGKDKSDTLGTCACTGISTFVNDLYSAGIKSCFFFQFTPGGNNEVLFRAKQILRARYCRKEHRLRQTRPERIGL